MLGVCILVGDMTNSLDKLIVYNSLDSDVNIGPDG